MKLLRETFTKEKMRTKEFQSAAGVGLILVIIPILPAIFPEIFFFPSFNFYPLAPYITPLYALALILRIPFMRVLLVALLGLTGLLGAITAVWYDTAMHQMTTALISFILMGLAWFLTTSPHIREYVRRRPDLAQQ